MPNELPTATTPDTALVRAPPTETVALSMDTISGFEALQRAAKLLCRSTMVPVQYQGENGLPNAVIALEMATRLRASPLMVMQNLYVVHGAPGWSAKFLTASVNSCGRFTALRYESNGEPGKADYRVRAWAVERATGEKLIGPWLTWAMVNAEGWLGKAGSKWKTMPEVMGMYRAAAFWVRAYAPEVSMGLQTREELEERPPVIVDVPSTVETTDMPPREPTTGAEGVKAKLRERRAKSVAPAPEPAPAAAPETRAPVPAPTAVPAVAPAAPPAPAVLTPADLANMALSAIAEMDASSMGAVGSNIARNETALAGEYPRVLRAYQARRRAIERTDGAPA